MNKNNASLLLILLAAFALIALTIAVTIGVMWLGWQGGWYGITAVILAHVAGSIGKAFRD